MDLGVLWITQQPREHTPWGGGGRNCICALLPASGCLHLFLIYGTKPDDPLMGISGCGMAAPRLPSKVSF